MINNNISFFNFGNRQDKVELFIGILWLLSLLLPFEIDIFGERTEVGIFGMGAIVFLYIIYKNLFVNKIKLSYLDYFVFLLFFLMYLSIFFADSVASYLLLSRLLFFLLGAISYFFIRSISPRAKCNLLYTFLFLMFFWALLLIYQVVFSTTWGVIHSWHTAITDFYVNGSLSQIPEAGATFSGSNYIANWFFFAFFIGLALLINTNSKKSTVLLLSLTSIVGLALILTFSRAAWIGIAIALLLFLIILLPRAVFRNRTLILVLISIALLSLVLLLSPLSSYLDQKAIVDKSATKRIVLYEIATDIIKDHPIFGVGVGSHREMEDYYRAYPDFQRSRPDRERPKIMGLHNAFLMLAADNGIPVAIIFIFILITTIATSFRRFLLTRLPIYLGLALSYIPLIIMGLVDGSPLFIFVWPMIWLMIGLTNDLPMINNKLT